jgi:hypothetical protein
MSELRIKYTKPSEEDIEEVNDFFHECELMLEKERYSLRDPQDKWKDLDPEDDNYILIEKIHKELIEEEGSEVDIRVVLYEYLVRKFARVNPRWRRVVFASNALVEAFCDPMERTLEPLPGLDLLHVAPEQ